MSIEKPVKRFLEFCLDGPIDNLELGDLIEELDRLVVATYLPEFEYDKSDYPEAPVNDYSSIRTKLSNRFPKLGFYCTVDCEPESIENAKILTGDAIDDLADIVGDLKDVLWFLENTSINNAMWHFEFSYRSHWGFHLRELQLFLHRLWW